MIRKAIASLVLTGALALGAVGCAGLYSDGGWAYYYPPDDGYGSVYVEPDYPIVVGPFGHWRDHDEHHHEGHWGARAGHGSHFSGGHHEGGHVGHARGHHHGH